MRKKTILSIGALALALGLGVTAMNAGGFLSLPFAAVVTAEGDPVEPTYLTFKGAIPESESVIPVWENLQSCSFKFTDANPGTFPGIKVNRDCGKKIIVQTSTFGQFNDDSPVVYEIDVTDESAVFVDKKIPTQLKVVFPEALKLAPTGNFAYYKVTVPAGVVSTDSASSTEINPDNPGEAAPVIINNDVSAEYTIKKTAQFTTEPSSDATVSSLAGGLSTVRIKYENLTSNDVVSVASGAKASLYYVNPAINLVGDLIGEYTLSVSGSDVIMTLPDDVKPSTSQGHQYYRIVVPAGSINVQVAGEIPDENPLIEITNIKLVGMDISAFQIEGFPSAGESMPVKDTPKEFVMKMPCPMQFSTSIKANIYPVNNGTISTIACATYTGTPSEDKTSVTFVMGARTSDTSTTNYPEWWANGQYVLSFPTGTFTDPVTRLSNTTNLVTPAWNGIDGLTTDPFISVTGNLQISFYKDKVKVDPSPMKYYGNSEALKAIPSNFGIALWTVKFLNSCKPDVNNENAKVRIMREGDPQPVLQFGPTDKINGQNHIWVGNSGPLTYKTESTATNNSSWGIYYNVSKETDQIYTGNEAGTNKYFVIDYLKTIGNYTLEIDEGFFIDKNGNPSQAVSQPFSIVGDIKYDVLPQDKTTLDEIKTVTVTYPEGAKVNVPAGTKIQLTREYSFSSQDAYLPYFNVTGSGNVVTLELDEPYDISDINAYFQVSIPAGTWTVDYNGETIPNEAIKSLYKIYSIKEGTVSPAPNIDGEAIPSMDLTNIVYTASSEVYSGASAYLYTKVAEGETPQRIATYSAVIPEDEDGNPLHTKDITWTTTTDLSEISGDVEFVIPEDAITYRGYNSNLTGKEAYSFDYKIKTTPLFTKLFTLVDPSEAEIYPSANSGMGFRLIAFDCDDTKLELGEGSFSVLYNGAQVASIPVSSAAVDFLAPGQFPGFAEIDFSMANDFDYAQLGEYEFVVPNGAFKLNGEAVYGTSYKVTVVAEPEKEVDFTYVLNPDPATEIPTLETVSITFPNAEKVDYPDSTTEPIAVLTNEDGSFVETCKYPKFNGSNGLIFEFGNSNTVWAAGKYTLTINPNTISVNDDKFDASVMDSGNFKGMSVEYTLTGTPADENNELANYLTLQTPSTLEANASNTRMPVYGVVGMGVVSYTLKGKPQNFRGVQGSDFIVMRYSATEGGELEAISSLNPANDENISIYSHGLFDDNDIPTSEDSYASMMMLFCNDGDGNFDTESLPLFRRNGYYTIEIPDGAFEYVKEDGTTTKLKGLSLTYHYVDEDAPVQTDYILTPADGESVKDPASVFGSKGSGIVLEFPAAKMADFLNSPATLTTPDNQVMTKVSPKCGYTNKITWQFGGDNTVWPTTGTYTFTVKPGYIFIDMGFAEDYDGAVGNFPGLTALYHAGDPAGILMYGVEQADSYNVYTIDGKVVKLNAQPDDMFDLQPGLYIINGKKAFVRK